MPKTTLAANPRTMPKVSRPVPTEKDFIDDLSYLPDRYAMVCLGDCLEPEIASGACLIFDKTEPYARGDLVIVFRRRELTPAGQFQGIVKRLVMPPPPWVTFPFKRNPKSELEELMVVEMINPRQLISIRCADVIGVHKCLGVAPSNVKRVKMELPDAARKGG